MFDSTIIKDHVIHEGFSNDTKVVSLQHYARKENGTKIEDTVLHVRILACTMGASKMMNNIRSMSLYGNKRVKTNNQNASYNRCFLVADLSNPPHCAVILTRSSTDSAALLKYTQGETFIGADYYIREPNLIEQTIADVLPIISLSLGNSFLYPLKFRDSSFPDTESKMEYPTKAGETNYFTLKNNNITIQRPTLVNEQSCTGTQCDCQKHKSECSCLHGTSSTSFVYSFDVSFKVPFNINMDTGKETVYHFTSLRTTKLFFANFEEHSKSVTVEEQKRNQLTYRNKIKAIVTYINNSGGWTVVGWFKLGETVDAASDSREKVENYAITMHISYLMPTNKEEVMNSAAFKTLQISSTTFPTANPSIIAPIDVDI